MPIRFRCVYCNQLLGIARRKAGTIVNCPHCGERLIVPTPELDEETAPAKPPRSVRPAAPAPNKPQRPAPVQRGADNAEVAAPQPPSLPRSSPTDLPNRSPAQSQPPLPSQPARAVMQKPPAPAEPSAATGAAASPPAATGPTAAPIVPAPPPQQSPAVRLFEQSDIAKLLLADLNAEGAEAAANVQPGPGKVGRRPGSNQPEEATPAPDAQALSGRTITLSIKLATIISVATVLGLAFSFIMGVLVGRFLLR